MSRRIRDGRALRSSIASAALIAAFASCSGSKAGADAPGITLPGLQATPGSSSETRVARVRIYAATGYRAQVVDWERVVAARIERVSDVLEPTLGLELELAGTASWERSESGTLDGALRELQDLDPGADVDWVVGLVDSLPEVSQEFAALGRAPALGRHVVARGLNPPAEKKLIAEAYPELDQSGREEAYRVLGEHKESVLLLHMLGHSLGAMHAEEETGIMRAQYATQIERFASPVADFLRGVLAHRFGDARDEAAARRDLRTALQRSSRSGWSEGELERALRQLDERVARRGTTRLPELGGGVRPTDRKAFRAARRQLEAGRLAAAWEDAEPLVEFYPDDPAVQILACRIRGELEREGAAEQCRRALELAPDSVVATVYVARLLVDERPGEALEMLRSAEATLLEMDDGATELWLWLAEAYRTGAWVSRAEASASRAGAAGQDITEWSALQRAKFALPPGDGSCELDDDDEPGYLEAVRGALREIYGRKWSAAEARIAALRRRHPRCPASDLLRCDLEFRRRRFGQAERACRRALEIFAGASWPNYLSGIIAKRRGNPEKAIGHLERAIDLDPGLEHAYQVLAELLEGRPKRLEALRARYEKRFGRALP